MTVARNARLLAAVAASALLATACGSSLDNGGSSSSGGSTGGTVKIGYVAPITGALAAFGEGDQYVVDQMTSYFKSNPIQAGGKSYSVEILLKDSQSDPKRAGEVAGELINTDGVDILMAHATPETTVPVAAQCEANATPCITADTPWQPWVAGMGANPGDKSTALKWSYHFFWGLEDITAVWMDIWGQVSTNKKVGALFANDAVLPDFEFHHGFHESPAIFGNIAGREPTGELPFGKLVQDFFDQKPLGRASVPFGIVNLPCSADGSQFVLFAVRFDINRIDTGNHEFTHGSISQ